MKLNKILIFLIVLVCLGVYSKTLFAKPDLDRKYRLESIGFLKAWDNVDGVFAEVIAESYKKYFNTQSRFRLRDTTKANSLISQSKLPLIKTIYDNDVLKRITRKMSLDSLIRTKVYKDGIRYRIELEWLHAPKMDVLSNHIFYFQEPKQGEVIGTNKLTKALHDALDELIAKVPFHGHVSGRDTNWVTVNIEHATPLRTGDILVVGTLEEVKKHPLMKKFVDWRFVETGKLEVDRIDGGIAFCQVVEENKKNQVAKLQKVIRIYPKKVQVSSTQKHVSYPDGQQTAKISQVPSLGWGGGTLWVGSVARQHGDQGSVGAKEGSGLLIGAKMDGQLWINHNVFTELSLGYGRYGYSQSEVGSSTSESVSLAAGGVLKIQGAVGYLYSVKDRVYGPKVWAKLGYHQYSYQFAYDEDQLVGPSSFKGLFIGVGGDLPLRGKYGALMSLDIGISPSINETDFSSGDSSGVMDVSFTWGHIIV